MISRRFWLAALLAAATAAPAGADTAPARMLADTFAHFLPPPAPGAERGRIDRHWMSETYRRGVVAAANYTRGPASLRIWISAGNRPDEAVRREAAMPAHELPKGTTRTAIRNHPALVEARAMPGAPHFRYIRVALPNGIVVYLRGELPEADAAHYLGAIDFDAIAGLGPK